MADETVTIGGVLKRVTTFDDLNTRYALLQQAGSPSVYVSREDFLPIQDGDLKRRLASEVVVVGEKDGKPIYTSAFKFWTEHARRHVYRRAAFTSKAIPDDTINLFRGFGVVPKPGNCDRIISHIREVICSGNETDADAMLKLLAWQIQNIGEPSRIIVILKSEQQQVGKGVLLDGVMTKIYGQSGFSAAQTDQILGRFNSKIRGCAFVFLDEVLFSGDRKAADGIKSLSTATGTGIEEKGLPIVQCPVALNFWLASNHENAAFIEEHDARYWALEVSPHRVGDVAYFSTLMEEINSGGREAFAHYLLNLDVSGFVPFRDVPKNNAVKDKMIRLSINPYDARKWLEECCHTGRLIGAMHPDENRWIEWVEGESFSFATLRDAYTEWQKSVRSPVAPKPTPIGNLGEVFGKAGLERSRTKSDRRYALPCVESCLASIWARDRVQSVKH
ncbi:primase-helicase family protein [Methylocystis sp. ATCC 49242]|uniref:primase-helicase family protein n=1 Tax=Methylocystis sp. ATCC 49242 TaxID=622637 RepID=UPI001AEBFA2D|nr:primase-helicase family protein [Methylocystis sp. ATCC 49242]